MEVESRDLPQGIDSMEVRDGEGNLIDTSTKPVPWRDFEEQVADCIVRLIDNRKIGLESNAARVLRKPAYYSKDRQANIVFDVSIEIFSSMQPTQPYLIWLWEAKNYPSRNVTVDEVEEFQSKLLQVGAHKGTIVTRQGFQEGAIALAKSFKIGLMTLVNQEEFIVQFSNNSGTGFHEFIAAPFCLYTFGDVVSGPHLTTLIDYELFKLGEQ